MTVLNTANKVYGGTALAAKVYAGANLVWPAAPAGYSAVILGTSGLVAYWRLGETSGLTAVAAAGGVNATHVNGPTVGVAGATTDGDKAVTYNGTTQYSRTILLRNLIGIERPTPMAGTIQDVGDNVTMEAWINRGGAAPGGWRGIVSKGTGGYYMRLDGGTGQLALVKSRVALLGVSAAANPVPTTGWHHVVCTKNGAAIKQYIDGVDRTGTMTNATFVDNDEAISIGCDTYPTGGAEFFQGSIDEVAIYNRVLTPAEVLAHYNAR
jgi:Concanavalin A-like lectin/glucanases superfamily